MTIFATPMRVGYPELKLLNVSWLEEVNVNDGPFGIVVYTEGHEDIFIDYAEYRTIRIAPD